MMPGCVQIKKIKIKAATTYRTSVAILTRQQEPLHVRVLYFVVEMVHLLLDVELLVFWRRPVTAIPARGA